MNERLGYDMMLSRRDTARSNVQFASRRAHKSSFREDTDVTDRTDRTDFRTTYDAVARTNEHADRSRVDRQDRPRRSRGDCSRMEGADEGHNRYDDEIRSRRPDEYAERDNQVRREETDSSQDDRYSQAEKVSDDSQTVDAAKATPVAEKAQTHVGDDQQSLPATSRDQGWQIIRQSLAVISEIFQLDLAGPLEDLDINEVSDQVVSQFAEILQMLKGMAGVLDESAQEKMALQLQGMTIEPDKAVELSKAIRFEAFRLEMAFCMIGVGEKVGSTLAAGEGGLGFTGIPVAQNPAELQMPSYQLDQILDQLLNKSESTIDSIVGKMKDLAEGADGGQTAHIGRAVAVKPNQSSQEQLKALDSPVFRAMLKIDGEHQGSVIQSFNADSGNNGGNQGSGHGGAFQQNQAFLMQALTQMQQNPENSGLELSVDATGAAGDRLTTQFQMLDSVTRSSIPSYKTIEESVMHQVNERLSAAVRNGVHEVRIHLSPESLGEVQLKIQMEGDVVTAKIRVENQQVRQIVEANLQALRDSLEEQNLHAGSIDVDVNHHSGGQTQTASGDKGHNYPGGRADISTVGEQITESRETGVETGRRFGDNTVEYFA